MAASFAQVVVKTNSHKDDVEQIKLLFLSLNPLVGGPMDKTLNAMRKLMNKIWSISRRNYLILLSGHTSRILTNTFVNGLLLL